MNAVGRDIIKVLKSVLGFPLDRSKCQKINVVLTWMVFSLACKSTCNSITYKEEKTLTTENSCEICFVCMYETELVSLEILREDSLAQSKTASNLEFLGLRAESLHSGF